MAAQLKTQAELLHVATEDQAVEETADSDIYRASLVPPHFNVFLPVHAAQYGRLNADGDILDASCLL